MCASQAEAELSEQAEGVNKKRKAEQLAVAPRLMALEGEWVGSVKKNIEIEAQCLKLEAECANLKAALRR